MSEKPTPGPWQSAWDVENSDLPRDDEWLIRNDAGDLVVYSTWYDGPRLACTEADARLIAAAPDLLAALKKIAWLDTGQNSRHADAMSALLEVEAIARAAIKRVEGGDEQ